MATTIKRRWGLKGKDQLPLLMVWDEIWQGGEVVHAWVLFSSRDLRSLWYWRHLFNRMFRRRPSF